jgi:hypothetical protein
MVRNFFNFRLFIIKHRDKYTCRNCGQFDFKAHIHHIDQDRNNNCLINLITLCIPCHRATHKRLKKNEHNTNFDSLNNYSPTVNPDDKCYKICSIKQDDILAQYKRLNPISSSPEKWNQLVQYLS